MPAGQAFSGGTVKVVLALAIWHYKESQRLSKATKRGDKNSKLAGYLDFGLIHLPFICWFIPTNTECLLLARLQRGLRCPNSQGSCCPSVLSGGARPTHNSLVSLLGIKPRITLPLWSCSRVPARLPSCPVASWPPCLGFQLLQSWFSWSPPYPHGRSVHLLSASSAQTSFAHSDLLPRPLAGLSQNLPGLSNSFYVLDLPALHVFSTDPWHGHQPGAAYLFLALAFACDPQCGWFGDSRNHKLTS